MHLRRAVFVLVVIALIPRLFAADTTRKFIPENDEGVRSDTVRAATSNAVRNLYDEVGRLPITRDWTVRTYLKSVRARDDFVKTLQSAEQVGDPRWVNHMCQVQLEIPAQRVSYTLTQFVAANPKKSAITVTDIERASRGWPQTVFGATGSAAGSGADIRPRAGTRWANIPADLRQRALDDAAAAAADRVMNSVRDLPIGERKTLGDAFADSQIKTRIRSWLTSRPMTRVDFQDNLDVEVALAADPRDFFNITQETLQNQNKLPVPKNPEDWRDLEKNFLAKTAPAVGRAHIQNPAVAPAANLIRLPAKPPAWINKPISVTGTSPAIKGSKLRTERAAERDAQAKLDERIELLELDNNLTLGQAARQDPRLASAISRTV